MPDLNHQNLNCVQSDKNLAPTTIASAATIAPVHRFTILTGTVAVATITPPVTGYHELVLMFTNVAPAALPVTGNIGAAYLPVQNKPFILFYDPVGKKYWPMAVA